MKTEHLHKNNLFAIFLLTSVLLGIFMGLKLLDLRGGVISRAAEKITSFFIKD